MGNQNPLRRYATRLNRAVEASDKFAKRFLLGIMTIGYGVLYSGGAVVGWLFHADPMYYFWTGGSDWMALATRTFTDPIMWIPGVFSVVAVLAFTAYMTPSEQRVRTLESDV